MRFSFVPKSFEITIAKLYAVASQFNGQMNEITPNGIYIVFPSRLERDEFDKAIGN